MRFGVQISITDGFGWPAWLAAGITPKLDGLSKSSLSNQNNNKRSTGRNFSGETK
jgi:hypothetical protein